jgi:predicted aldo/keto reductase-like oxidoreductase
MSNPDTHPLHRREFLQAGAVASAAVTLAAGSAAAQDQDQAASLKPILPLRKLGKTGAEVTILNAGTWRAPDSLPRILRSTYRQGVRYFDTAKSYNTEPGLNAWLKEMPAEVGMTAAAFRKSIFLATKDFPTTPSEMLRKLDDRLRSLETEYLDLLYIHHLGDRDFEKELGWITGGEFKETAEKIRKTGKCKYVGFTTHHARRAELLQAAAATNFVDVIMLQYSPWLEKGSALDKALDACHEAGIGLISMKQIAGNSLAETSRNIPKVLKDRNLTPAQGLLQAIWTDERITNTCVSMKNLDQIRENVEAARDFKPLSVAELDELRDAYLAAGPTMCADCDGRCARAAGTTARLGDLVRYYTYHEHHGHRADARRYYAELTEAERDWRDADLAAAREACPNKLDFARLLPETDRLLG